MSFIQSALAQAESAPGPGGGLTMVPLLLIMFGLMYFLIIRPQSKKAKEHAAMVKDLTKGDEVVTSGGILGKVTQLDEQFLTVKISADVEIKVQRHTIGAVMPKGTFKE